MRIKMVIPGAGDICSASYPVCADRRRTEVVSESARKQAPVK